MLPQENRPGIRVFAPVSREGYHSTCRLIKTRIAIVFALFEGERCWGS
jgi:hypothetical protein